MKSILLAGALAALSASAAAATTLTGSVSGTATIFGTDPVTPSGATAPVSIDVSGVTGSYITITANGFTDCCNGLPDMNADGSSAVSGYNGGNSTIYLLNGVSGINAQGRQMFLTGVFVNSGALPSGRAPVPLTYGAGDLGATSYAPLLDQSFFVGDGLTGTGSGAPQQFVLPAGANTLWLGFADAGGFFGTPGSYGDNTGSLDYTVDLDPASVVPLPATLPMLAGTLGLLGLMRRRKAARS